MSGRKKLITSALTRRRVAAGGTAALVLSPFIIRPGVAQRATVNIGVIQPLSGANAQFGVNCRNGIELVADEINAAGGIKALGGAKISLVVSDATSNPTIAPAVARRLIAENDLTAVIGAFASSLTLAISEVTARPRIWFSRSRLILTSNARLASSALTEWLSRPLTRTSLNQPVCMMRAMPAASLRSLLLICILSTALA